MYKYAYETISCNLEGWGLGAGNVYCIDEYRSVIEKGALQGWRYWIYSCKAAWNWTSYRKWI